MDRLQIIVGRVAHGVAGHQVLIVEDDALQHVVEIMRDAASELADGLHLLAMGKAQFQFTLFGNVDDIGDRRPAIAVERDKYVDMARFGAG